MVTTGADHSMMDRSLMILENEHALLEDKQTACESLERYFNHLLQSKTDLTPSKIHSIKVVKILLQYVEQEGDHKLTIPALTALRPAVELIAKNVSFSAGMKLASLCYEALLKSYRTCDTSCQAGILVEMFRCMSKFNDAQFFEAITSRKAPYAELKEVCESFMSPSTSSKEMDLNRQAVRLEALRFLKRFLRVAGGAMLTQIEQEMCYWVDLLLQHMFILFKENNKVGYREMEVSIRQEARQALELLISKMTPGAQLRSEKWLQIKKDIRDVYADLMVKMVGTCSEWSEQWILVLQLLDKELITKGNNHLINRLLNVEERAFKYDKAEVRMVAFTCWCHLIDKFIPDDCENYRESVVRSVRLLMQPLQANNARTEAIALQKLYTWWHLMHRLESCPEVLVTTILSPFFGFCFGSPKLKDQCPGKKFLSLHLPSAQSLLFILDDRPEDHLDRKAEEIVLQSTKQKVVPFKKPLLNSVGLFLHISEELIFSVGECITVLSSGNYECSKELIQKMWQFLLSHIQKALKSSNEQSVKMVQDLLRLLRQLTERETSTVVLLDYYVNILLEDVVKSAKALPGDVLAAPMYYVGNGPRFMAGTPALLLVECMMSEQLLPLIRTNTRYVSLLKYLVNFGVEHCNTLDFIQAVMKNMESLNCNLEEMCLLWNIVASACIKYLKSGGQVNQGSDQQHDFTWFYVMLMFPLQHICSVTYSEACEVVLVWHELYKLFCGVAKSTVTNLDVVEIQETVACKLNQILIKNAPKAAKEAIAILKVTQDIVNSIPFSEVFGPQPQSKRRGRASCGISNMLNLVMKMPRLLNAFERVEEFFNTSWALLAIITDVMYKNMKQANAMPVALQLSDTVSAVLQVQVVHDGTSRFCSDSILKMWKDYLRFMEMSLSKKSLKDAVSWLCVLLELGFKNTLLEVRTATIEFWDNCLYPLCHKEGLFMPKELQELREKCGSTVARHSVVVADSEDDNASDIQHLSSSVGRANKENICNAETVVKQMNDAVFAIPEAVVKGKSKSLVQQLKDDGHVLTRHQKEILRSKKDDIPALYSSSLQPEQDSQYSQNSEGSQDTLEFTGPSRILEPVVEEAMPAPDRSLKVLEPPSSQRRLAEYRKKMMIDDEGSIILTAVSTAKEPESDLAVPATSSVKNSNEACQDIEGPDVALLPPENCNTLNNRKLNLESVAVPMLSTVLASNTAVSVPEVRLSISNPPAQMPATTDAIETGHFPLEEAPVENSVRLDSQRNLLMAPNALQHLVKSTNRDTLSENRVINAPVLLQDYVDFPPVEFVNTSVTAPPKTDMTSRPVTELQNMSAEYNSSKSIPNEKESKPSVNYFKAVSIALVDDDEEEEDDDNAEMLNISVGSKCDNAATSRACESLEQCGNEMDIQKTNRSAQGVDAVKVVVEKVEDFSLNKTFAALETIAASTFDSAELEHISPRAGDICSSNNENTRKSTNKSKGKSITKDPVELDLQKLFEVGSPNSSDSHKDDSTDEQKPSPQQAQKPAPRGRGRPRKDANNSAAKSTTNISPSLITGSKAKLKHHGKLTADISKNNKFAHNAMNSTNKDQNIKEKEIIAVEEISKEKLYALPEVEVKALLTKDAADNSLLNSLSDNFFVPNIVPTELIKGDDTVNNKSDMAAKSNMSRCDSKDIKPSNAKKALISHDKVKEKSPLEKRKRKRSSSVIKENTEQKTKRPRRSKLPSKIISTGESEVPFTDKNKSNKAAGRPLNSGHPSLFSVTKNNPHVKNDNAVKDGHAVMHSNSVTINNKEKHNFKESNTFEFGKSVLSNTTVQVCGTREAGEENKLEKVPIELNTSITEKNSLPHTDNSHSSKLMAKGGDKSLEGKHIQVTDPNINQKNDSSLKPKSKLSKKETAEKKVEMVPTPLRKLRSAAKGNVQRVISASLKVDETVKVSESIAAETQIKSPKSQSVSSMENKDSSSQVSSMPKSKPKLSKPSKNETEIGNKLTKEKEQEPSESQDVVESSQSNPSPSIFSWNNLKTCSVVVKKLDTNLEPGSKVNLDENLVLIKTPDHSSPYKVCSQELNSSTSVIRTADDRLANTMEKAKKNFQNVDAFSDVKLNSGPLEVDEAIKSVPKIATDLNSSGMSKEKSEAFVITKCVSSPAGNKSKSSVTSNGDLSVTETCKIKKISPSEEISQTKPKKAYIQTLITESISNVHERKEKRELNSSSREGVKTRHQKVISHPSAKEEAQSKEKVCPVGEEMNKAKSQTSKSQAEETNKVKSQMSKAHTEETNKTESRTSVSQTEETSKAKPQTSKSHTEETNKVKPQTSLSQTEETNKVKPQTSLSQTEETNKMKPQTSKSCTEETDKAKPQTSKSHTEETSKAKPQTSKSQTEETNKAKPKTSKPQTEETNKAKPQTSKPQTEETNKAKPQTSKSHTEETSKAKPQTSKPQTEETNKAKPQTSKPQTEETNKTKPQTLKSHTDETSKAKPQTSKSHTEETSKVKPQTLKSPSEVAQTKVDAVENVEKDHNYEEQGTNAHPFSAPKLQTKIHLPTKIVTVQSCNTKPVPEAADNNSVHKETIKPRPASSEPLPSDTEMKSSVGNVATVKKKLSSVEVEMSSSSEKINTQTTKSDALLVVSETGSEEEALNSKAQEAKSSVITDFEPVKQQDDNGSAVTAKEIGHVQTEGVEAQLVETLNKSESEKSELKSKVKKPKLLESTSETASVGIKENVQPFISIEEVVKSKADKLRVKQLENKLLNEGLVKSKRKQKLVVISAKDKLEKSTELATSDDTSLSIETSEKISEENIPSLPSDAPDKEKSTTSKSAETKEKSVRTAKLKKNSLRLSTIKSCLSNDTSDVPNSESTSVSENENNTVLQPVSGKELDHAEKSKCSIESDKVNKTSISNISDTSKQDTVKDKASQHLLGEELDRPQNAESEGVTGQEAAVATVSPSSPQVEKIASDMQHAMKVSDSATGRRKRRGRPPNLNTKRLFPLSRKRSITKESPYKISKNESETTPKSPKMRKLFNTDGHEDLIITPTVVLQSPKSKADDTTEALSTPTSSKSISLPLASPENTSPSAPSSMENVPASTPGERPTPAVQTSATDGSTSASDQTSPSTLPSCPSTSSISSLASCPLTDVSSSETSPPKTALIKTSSPKLSSPKSLLNSPSSLLKAFSSSPSTAEPKQSRIGHHATLAGRAQFMVGLALVSKEGKSASESSANHDSTSATEMLFSSSPTGSTSAVDSPAEKQTMELTSTPVKRRSLLMDPKRRLNAKKKRVSFSETPLTILYECHANEKKRVPSKSSKTAPIKSSEEPTVKKARMRPELDHDTSDDEVMILHADSETATSSNTTIQEADSPDLSGLSSQGSLQEVRTELLNSQQPIFPQLSNCNHPVEAVVAQLTNHPMWTKAFLNEMYQRNIRTIGDLSRCDEVTINRLPIPVPKVAHTKKVLQDYQRTLSLLPRRGFWNSVGSRLLEQEATSTASLSPSTSNAENPMQRLNLTDCAKFLANNPKSLHAIIEEAVKIPHAQEKLRKEVESIREELLGAANVGGMEVDSQQQLDKMVEYVMSHREQFLNKIPVVDLCKYLAMRSPEETEKWILECLRTYLRAGSFSFLEKLSSPDNSVDLLNIIQSYIMVKRPIADILEGMPKDGVLHFATSKLTLADKMIMCAESLVTDNSPVSHSQFQKLMNAIITKMKMSGALDLISQMVTEKLKSMDL